MPPNGILVEQLSKVPFGKMDKNSNNNTGIKDLVHLFPVELAFSLLNGCVVFSVFSELLLSLADFHEYNICNFSCHFAF